MVQELNERNKIGLLDHTTEEIYKKEGYEYHPTKKFKFFGDLLWKILRKLGCLEPHMRMYKTYQFHPKKIESFREDVYWLLEGIGYKNVDDYVILAGEDRFRDLIDESVKLDTHMSFTLPVTYNTAITSFGNEYISPHNVYQTYFGMYVLFAPNISGIALVPKIILEKVK